MSGIVNSLNSSRSQSNINVVAYNWKWSKSDIFKYMIYSVLSCFGSGWATSNLQTLKLLYQGATNPNIDRARAVANVVQAQARLRVSEARKATLTGISMIKRLSQRYKMSQENTIKYLIRADSLWPAGEPTSRELIKHVIRVVYSNGKPDWVATQPYTDGLKGFEADADHVLNAIHKKELQLHKKELQLAQEKGRKFPSIFSNAPSSGPLRRYLPLTVTVRK